MNDEYKRRYDMYWEFYQKYPTPSALSNCLFWYACMRWGKVVALKCFLPQFVN